MKEKEFNYYESQGNWDFSDMKRKTEKLTNWNLYEVIRKYTNQQSLCLDLGTGGGEKVLKYYPEVGMVIGTDYSKAMINTAKENQKYYPEKRVTFTCMDSLNMTFPEETFDLISARHTCMDANQVYQALKPGGVIVIQGVDQKDCWDLKEMFGRGQAFHDEISISQKDYDDLKEAGFTKIEKIEILQNEYYETEQDLMALLLKAPILDDFSEVNNEDFEHKPRIEQDIFEAYVKKYKTEKGILLKRVLYGIVARK